MYGTFKKPFAAVELILVDRISRCRFIWNRGAAFEHGLVGFLGRLMSSPWVTLVRQAEANLERSDQPRRSSRPGWTLKWTPTPQPELKLRSGVGITRMRYVQLRHIFPAPRTTRLARLQRLRPVPDGRELRNLADFVGWFA